MLAAGLVLTPLVPARAQAEPPGCEPAVARLVALQGAVEVQRADSEAWVRVTRLDTTLCAGDRLRTGALSRAGLHVQPETVVRVDQNTVITLNHSAEEIAVEFFVAELADRAANARTCGAGYFITRFPKKFKVRTPHMNAAVEGTEFMVESSCKATSLTVLEGAVASESVATGRMRIVGAGERIASDSVRASEITAVIRPLDAVQWVLRFPPISDQSATGAIPSEEQCNSLAATGRADCLATRAESLLRSGSVDEALAAIDAALALRANSSDGLALQAVTRLAKAEKAAALDSAHKATERDAGNYRAWLALSHAQQADFQLEAALESARKAQSLRAHSSLTQARVAELHLSLGDIRRAEEAARAAVASNPSESHAHGMLGFVHLAQIDTEAARADFSMAIERDSFSALPRLGLGLALIREGDLTTGREQIEIAVALDPSNSLLRSYAGKAYYEENSAARDKLAATQFEIAESLDPLDPTAYFYDAILRQSQNRPVDALLSLSAAAVRNNNRAVYRSKLLLEDDAASRGATVAAIYGDLGFERLEINESSKALADNFGNASAHRELASAYASMPRHDIARVSEALQAQIRQPVSIAPVPALLGTDSLLFLKDAGPSQLGAQEFNRLFNQEEHQVAGEAIAGNRETLGGQLVLSGLVDRVAYSLSALDQETEGFTENDAAEKAVYDLFVQGQLGPGSTMQLDLKRSEIDVGQTFFEFEPFFAEPTTISEVGDSLRFSGHHGAASRNDWIWTAVYEDRAREIASFPDGIFFTGNDSETTAAEVQGLWRIGQWDVVGGIGYVDQRDDYVEEIEVSTSASNAYLHGYWRSASTPLVLQLGTSFDSFELENSAFDDRIEKRRVNPRFGLIWSPGESTTVRASIASTLKRPLVRGQTIEPTQVAGFNQYFTGFERFFGDPDGTVSARIGIGVDHAFSGGLRGGFELSRRDLEVVQLEGNFDWDERSAIAYLYRTFRAGSWQGAVSLDGEYEKIERPPEFTGAEGILELETMRVPLAAMLSGARGLTLRAAVTYVHQQGRFTLIAGEPVYPKDDEAFIADLALEFKLPRRRGKLSIGVKNAFDEFIDLLEIDPLNPRVATRQLVFGRIDFNF